MTNKVDQSGFQLDPNELTKDCPALLKGIAKQFVAYVNGLDVNHDGKSDVEEVAPLVIKAMPAIMLILPLIDWNQVIAFLKAEKLITDAEKFETAIQPVITLVNGLPK